MHKITIMTLGATGITASSYTSSDAYYFTESDDEYILGINMGSSISGTYYDIYSDYDDFYIGASSITV